MSFKQYTLSRSSGHTRKRIIATEIQRNYSRISPRQENKMNKRGNIYHFNKTLHRSSRHNPLEKETGNYSKLKYKETTGWLAPSKTVKINKEGNITFI